MLEELEVCYYDLRLLRVIGTGTIEHIKRAETSIYLVYVLYPEGKRSASVIISLRGLTSVTRPLISRIGRRCRCKLLY